MAHRAKAFIVTIAIFAAFGAVFVYPQGIGARLLPWRLGLDLVGGSHLVYEVDLSRVDASDRTSVMNGLRDVVERRVNLFGVSEPQVYTAKSGDSERLVVELAGVRDVRTAIAEIGATPFLLFAEVASSSPAAALPGDATGTSTAPFPVFAPTELTGRYVKSAELVFNQITGTPEVFLEFTDEGARIFERITERNVGKQVGVFLDGELLTAPVVREKIVGGRAQITGDFTRDEARTLVERFNAGALPAPITLIGQQTVGASLGADSLQKTLWAGWFGSVIIMLFMIAYYRYHGVFSACALLIYILLTLSVFKLFAVTMTLSGIAGIVLSIGMAVDANILIFERSKEEVRRGLARFAALEEGFRRAWLSIRDSNTTTIITSIILYFFTSGFIRGFALALLIGVAMSMFTALTVTRNLFRVFMRQQ